MPPTAASLGLTANQFANLIGIVRSVQARGWPVKAAYIAVEASLDESGMRVLASANVPASQQYPHDLLSWTSDGLGHDHASMGMLQQQTGYAWTPAGYGRAMNQTTIDTPNGWGTPDQLMHAQTSTDKFLDALDQHPWRSMSNWAAAQAVQGSAFADGSNYRAQDARAQQYVNAVWNNLPAEGLDPMITLSQIINGVAGWKIKNRLNGAYATVSQFIDQINATTYNTDKKVDALSAEVSLLRQDVAALLAKGTSA